MIAKSELAAMRNAKVSGHLSQYAPVWIVEETYDLVDHQLTFHAVFQHNLYSWVKRRYLYDGQNDVLYHKGQISLTEDAAMPIIANAPDFNTTVADTPNAYGG
jgi:hypothetical protein